MLVCATISAQDTTCVMITPNEILVFDYQTSEITDRSPIGYDVALHVNDGEVLCLHLLDGKKRFRDVTTTYPNGEFSSHTFESKDDVYFSPCCRGNLTIEVSQPRRTNKQ